jgi:hypothetical protein
MGVVKHPVINGKKRCTKCRRALPVKMFRRRSATYQLLRSICVDCERDVVRDWQRSNRKRYRELQQRWVDKQNQTTK